MALPVLDLNTPGSLWATASNEDQYTFHIVLPNPKYNKAALSKNPVVASSDQLMRPFTVSHTDVDGEGRAVCDLVATGRADDIIKKVNDISKNGDVPERVTGIVIATALPANRIPAKQLAEVQDFKLIAPAKFTLKGVRTNVTAKQYQAGVTEFLVELYTEGPLGKVALATSPKCQIKVDGGPSGPGAVALDAEHGKTFTVKIKVPLTKRTEKRTVKVPPTYRNWVPNGWRTGGARARYDKNLGVWVVLEQDVGKGTIPAPWGKRTDTRTIWTGGIVTFTAKGTGKHKDLNETVQLRAVGFASGWLNGPMPPPLSHNVC